MPRPHSLGRTLALFCAALVVAAGNRATAQQPTQQAGAHLTSGSVADQLGVTIRDDSRSEELSLGASITGTLDDAQKLALFGIRGMHKGARVAIMRVAPDRVRVEADELDPAPNRGAATLRMDSRGKLIAPRDT